MFAFATAMFLLALAVRPLPDCRCGRDQGIEVWSSEDKIHIRPLSLTRDHYNFDNRA